MQKGKEGNWKESGDEQSKDNFSVKAPELSLPKGGGAIRSIGEKFAANPVTGTGSMSIPIATSPGRSGFGPDLSLSYDSGSGNGLFGLGWNLASPSITRKTNKGLPQYYGGEEPDVFILSGAEDLVPVLIKEDNEWKPEKIEPRTVHGNTYHIQRYRPRIEGLFARIEYWSNKNDLTDCFWRSISRDNITTWYGKTDASRIADPNNKTRIFTWLICETNDDKGNVISFEYKNEDSSGINLFQAHERNRNEIGRSANRYLKRIKYGNSKPYFPKLSPNIIQPTLLSQQEWMFEVVFDYGEHNTDAPMPNDTGAWKVRKDPFSTYRSGFEIRTYRLCQRVLMFHHFPDEPDVGEDCLVRSTDFSYRHQQSPDDSQNPIHTVLDSVIQCGYQKKNNSFQKRTLPPVEFEYSKVVVGDTIKTVEPSSMENLPMGVDGSNYQWLDLDGEGLSGTLTQQGGTWFYKHNKTTGTRFIGEDNKPHFHASLGTVKKVNSMPVGGLSGISSRQFLDLDGNGNLDLVEFAQPLSGFYERNYKAGETENQNWETFRAFRLQPNINWNDPNLKYIDLNGDGHADILISEDQVFTWYPSLATEGFGEHRKVSVPSNEEQGPHVIFADFEQTIIHADLSGDGLTDIARIRNGEICYWPNLGYGHFGAKVAMDNAPLFDHPDQFNPKRIRLADIDGSGVTDIIYLGRNKTQFWFNQSGNRWGEAQILTHFPTVDNIASVATVDLLGNGTTCLVWSSPLPDSIYASMRYIELMADGKPHLMVGSKNNLGAETHIQYAPSTYFYLKDKQAGKPWITLLPFPVHVVEKVTVTDKWRKTSFSTSYSYHHGYFDGHEREFRGFGRVEQIDVETYGKFASGNKESPYIADDLTLYQPPIKTISWFHTGVAYDRKRILSHYKKEYFKGTNGFEERELPEPDLKQSELTAAEWREAMRSCKGMPLRQEIYELDVDALEQGEHKLVKIYSSAYHNCNIQMLQAQGDNQHAVFLVTESEAITYHYELDLLDEEAVADPRIAHTLNINIDEVGNVIQSVAVVYGRINEHVDVTLPDGTEELIYKVQGKRHLAYTESRFTQDIQEQDAYRLRLPYEILSYELIEVSPQTNHFTLDELRQLQLSEYYQSTGDPVAEIPYHHITPGEKQKRLIEHIKTLYFQDTDSTDPGFLKEPRPPGEIGHLGLTYETYKLALSTELLQAVLNDPIQDNKFTSEIKTDLDNKKLSGYLLEGDHYWICSGIAGFADEADKHFYLPERYTDAFDQTTELEYDARDLYIKSSTDPIGNTASVLHFDYRVLAPSELEDINDNLTEVKFDVLGLPAAVAVKGKGEQADNISGFSDELLNPDRAKLSRFFIEPRQPTETIADYQQRQQDEVRNWIGNATARHLYHFGEEEETLPNGKIVTHWGRHPASACGIVREKHVKQLEQNEKSKLQLSFEYSDGGGNVLVTKVQAEPESHDGLLRWIANGKTFLNNKGKPVKQYEPYFSENPIGEPSHRFEEPVEVGVTSVIYYDAAGRVIRVEFPDGTVSRVDFSPWHVSSYDQNDTVLEAGNEWYAKHTAQNASAEFKRAALLTEIHADTPTQVFLDSLGRNVISIEHNKYKDSAGNLHDEKYLTFTKLDAEGKPLWIQDARGNRVMQYITQASIPCYDIAGNLLFQRSMDGGDRWMISDATGQPFYAWDVNENEAGDSEDRLYHTIYDILRRPLEQQLRIGNDVHIIERFVYGENQLDSKNHNLNGQLLRHYDSSGLVTNEAFDFKGNLLEVKRQLTRFNENAITDWSTNIDLDETYTQKVKYDALNRMSHQQNWHIGGREPTIYQPQYNLRGLLQSESLTVHGVVKVVTEAIVNIVYDAKGQRSHIQYGNGTTTCYDYDKESFRLIQLRTTKTTPGESLPTVPSNLNDDNALQNLYYTYDPVGNITEIHDDAYEPVFFKNQQVEPRSRYRYDALYRLIKAEGRESAQAAVPTGGKLSKMQQKNFPIESFATTDKTLRNYTQTYLYDSVGNIKQMKHVAANNGGWTRNYEYEADNNRLKQTQQGTNTVVYEYDTHGSILNFNNVNDEYRLHYDSNDMIPHINLGGGGDAYYDYGSDKERSRKRIIKNNGSIVEERLYLGGMERYRRWEVNLATNDKQLVEEIETYHLFDGEQRVLMVENVIKTDNTNGLTVGVLYRYQYGNHLGSVGLEVDEAGRIISYEEYHPYGTTAFSARNSENNAAKKRYRYTGMARDEESGLSYHSARYYLPWLGRWGSVDPIGIKSGMNLYGYVRNRPINFYDPEGLEENGAPNRDPNTLVVALGRSNTDYMTLAEKNTGLKAINIQDTINLIRGNGTYWPDSNEHFELQKVFANRASAREGALYTLYSGVMVQEALEGKVAKTVHIDMRNVTITPKLDRGTLPGLSPQDYHTSAEARSVVAHLASTKAGERNVTIVIHHEEGISRIAPNSDTVKGDKLPGRIENAIRPSPKPTAWWAWSSIKQTTSKNARSLGRSLVRNRKAIVRATGTMTASALIPGYVEATETVTMVRSAGGIRAALGWIGRGGAQAVRGAGPMGLLLTLGAVGFIHGTPAKMENIQEHKDLGLYYGTDFASSVTRMTLNKVMP